MVKKLHGHRVNIYKLFFNIILYFKYKFILLIYAKGRNKINCVKHYFVINFLSENYF